MLRSRTSPPPLIFPLVVLLIGAPLLAPAREETAAYMTKNGHAEFTSKVPLYTFTGTSDHLAGKINLADSTVDFYLDLTTLKTGIGKRDKDMRETLETDTYPFAEFYGRLTTPFDSDTRSEQPATVRGSFKIHGVSREVTIDGTLQNRDGGLKVQAAWTLNLKDYDIVPPSLLIVTVDKIQNIRIEAVLPPVSS